MDYTEPFKLIGIHNEDPANLYVQFSLGDRYFMYEFNKFTKSEHIHEQCYDSTYSELKIEPQDEEYLMGKLTFFPKTKHIINEYRFHA